MNEPFGVTGIKDQVRFLQGKLKEAREERDEAREAIANANNSLFGSQGFFLSLDGGKANPHHLSTAIENLKSDARKYLRERDEAEARGFERGVKEAAQKLDKYSYQGCERGQTDLETGAFECSKEARGECNCHEFSEAIEAILALLEKPKDKTDE